MASSPDVATRETGYNGGSPAAAIRRALVDLVRLWLNGGISRGNLASSVRISQVRQLTGGMVADTVAEVGVDVRAVVKAGTADLAAHAAMMRTVNDSGKRAANGAIRVQKAIFPEVMIVVPTARIGWPKAATGSATHVMLMQALIGYQTLESWIGDGRTQPEMVRQAQETCLSMLRVIHSHRPPGVRGLRHIPTVVDPFSARLQERWQMVLDADPQLGAMWSSPGHILAYECPPLRVLLAEVTRWIRRYASTSALRLTHGDAHLGNVMVRRRGSRVSVRLIDPNPNIGFSQPVYDYGKVLLALTPAGLARSAPETCRTAWKDRGSNGRWRLDPSLRSGDKANRMRERLAAAVIRAARAALSADHPDWRRWLHVATASAQLGLAALKRQPEERDARRFALAYALAELIEWRRTPDGACELIDEPV